MRKRIIKSQFMRKRIILILKRELYKNYTIRILEKRIIEDYNNLDTRKENYYDTWRELLRIIIIWILEENYWGL